MNSSASDRILPLTKELVAIKSIDGNHEALDESLNLALRHLSEFTIERFERKGVKSALVYNTPTRPERFKILLNTHLDIIPAKEEQYIPREVGDRLYGAGVMDMKANLVAALFAFKDIAKEVAYPIALQLVTDEELGGFDGTKFQVEEGVRADFVLATEPTNFDIVHKAKGVLWLKITATGTTAHGAYPWRGDNAIWKIQTFLEALKTQRPIPVGEVWETTVNLSAIEAANKAYNKIPDECVVGLDIRFVPNEADTILESVTRLLPEGATVEILAHEPALATDADSESIKKLESISSSVLGRDIVLRGAQGSSDARHFQPVGCPGIEFGPIGGGIGSDDEWVDVPSLEKYYEIIKQFLRSGKNVNF